MCKHKSGGGMSKPTGAATDHRNSLTSSRTIACPIHNDPVPESSSVSSSTSQRMTTLQGQKLSEEDFSIHNEQCSNVLNEAESPSNEAHNGNDMCDGATCLDFNNLSSFQVQEAKSTDSEDEDIITEMSPMLNPPVAPAYVQQNLWNSSYAANYENSINDICSWVEDNPQNRCSSISNGCLVDAQYELLLNSKSEQQGMYFPREDRERYFDFQGSYTNHAAIVGNAVHYNDHGCGGNSRCEQNGGVSSGDTIPCNHFPLLCMHSFDLDGSKMSEKADYGRSYPNTAPMALEPMPGPSGLQRPNSVHWEIGTNDSDRDDEFRCRRYSLTPTVNFAVNESESASDVEEDADAFPSEPCLKYKNEDQSKICEEEQYRLPVATFHRVFPISPSAAQLSLASSYGESGSPICKICHMTAKENDPLISPCRCSGTMQYIHCGCLMRWLEISSKRSRKPASCELCQYQYHWHKKFKVRHWQFPHCSRRDKILHFTFFLSMIVMVACATITIMCFKQDKGTKINPDRTELTNSEIITLVCGVTFFLAFFVAMYVEVKSRSTIYKLLVKFIYLNQQWYIDEYEKKESAPVAV